VAATTPDALTWSRVAARLAPARNYWLGTTRPDGSPHAAPVWGVVHGEVLYLYTEVDTVKARNLRADPRTVVHLESGDDVLIVNGTLGEVADPDELAAVLPAFATKYDDPDDRQYLPVGPPREAVLRLTPESALSWDLARFETSQQRWSARSGDD
jgi:PPOX class probable F420-dependent enzyme